MNLVPGKEGTQVRMLAEIILIDVQGNTPEGSLGQVYKETSRLRKGLRNDVGGQELYHLRVGAYEKAVQKE